MRTEWAWSFHFQVHCVYALPALFRWKCLTNLFNYEYDCRINLYDKKSCRQNHTKPVSRFRFADPASYVSWVCCRFSTLFREVFLRYSGFFLSSNTNISKFQFDPVIHGHFWKSSCKFLGAPWVYKLHIYNYIWSCLQYFSCYIDEVSNWTGKVFWNSKLSVGICIV